MLKKKDKFLLFSYDEVLIKIFSKLILPKKQNTCGEASSGSIVSSLFTNPEGKMRQQFGGRGGVDFFIGIYKERTLKTPYSNTNKPEKLKFSGMVEYSLFKS